jgi:hypothetical protein
MSIKNTAVSAVLGLMFLSLLAIYIISAPSPLITFLSVLIMLVGLIMAQSQSWRDIGILASVSVIVSLVAVALVASERFGRIGTFVALLAWGIVLYALFSSAWRGLVTVPSDKAILIRNILTGHTYRADGPITAPNMPLMERIVAIIPLYELHEDLTISGLNATRPHNVDEIKMWIRYSVVSPTDAFKGIPRYTLTQEELASDMKSNVREARQNPAFWERLLGKQMCHEGEEIARDVFHTNVYTQNALDLYNNRRDVAEDIMMRLNEHVQRWGVKVQRLDIDFVKVDRDILRAINKKTAQDTETEDKRIEAMRDATRIDLVLEAEVNAEAKRVSAILAALKDAGVELTPELVVGAINAASDWQMEGDFSLLTQNPLPTPPSPAPAKPPEKK